MSARDGNPTVILGPRGLSFSALLRTASLAVVLGGFVSALPIHAQTKVTARDVDGRPVYLVSPKRARELVRGKYFGCNTDNQQVYSCMKFLPDFTYEKFEFGGIVPVHQVGRYLIEGSSVNLYILNRIVRFRIFENKSGDIFFLYDGKITPLLVKRGASRE